jgi:hypothetical protein
MSGGDATGLAFLESTLDDQFSQILRMRCVWEWKNDCKNQTTCKSVSCFFELTVDIRSFIISPITLESPLLSLYTLRFWRSFYFWPEASLTWDRELRLSLSLLS